MYKQILLAYDGSQAGQKALLDCQKEETCTFTQLRTGGDISTPDLKTSPKIIFFEDDSIAIKPEFQAVVETNARLLLADKKLRVAVAGHADGGPGREYGVAIGQQRAEAVRRALACLGVPDTQVEAVSLGKEKPAALGTDEASFAKNRRVEIKSR
jgi:peptidoglycan-associated lipoprotein